MLAYMLGRPSGCDAWLTRERFVVQYGWHLSHHRYFSDTAVEVVGFLRERIGPRHGVLPASTRLAVGGFAAWRHGARAVWIDTASDKITIVIREATSEELPPRPSPLEPPIAYVAGTAPCPACGQVPDRYRKLRGGSLVCLACGASHTR